MKTQHTPGPWKEFRFLDQDEKTFGAALYISNNSETEVVAMIELPSGTNDEKDSVRNEANTRLLANEKLIAAAPELLEALKKLYMAVYGGNSVSVEDTIKRAVKTDEFEMTIVSAIKKAEQ